jgi:RimJ/RimL family protein N-acetyltransferase
MTPATRTDVLAEVPNALGAPIIVRRPSADDAPAVLRYLRRVGAESEFLSFGAEGPPITEAEQRVFLASVRTSENAISMIAEQGGEIVGMLSFKGGNRARTRHVGEFGISVAHNAQGIGLGRRLMQLLIDWARAGGTVRKINLVVRTDNDRAIALYESFGFVTEGRRSRDMRIDGAFHDSLIMGLPIDPPTPA